MAKQNKSKRKPKRDKYDIIKRRLIGDKWFEVGDTINLTIEGARYLRQIHVIK